MKAIITKYATTSGVVILEGTSPKEFPSMFRPNGWFGSVHGIEWHDNQKNAVLAVHLLFNKKEKSLRRQLEKLSAKYEAALKVVASFQEKP